MKFAIVSKTY